MWLAPATIAIAFLALALVLLPDYGPTFDASIGDYAFGEYLLRYLATADESWLRFEPGGLSFLDEESHPDWRLSFPIEFVYPVPSTLSALGCEVFARRLSWMHPIDAHHLIAPVSFALLLALVFRFVVRRAGPLAAWCATLCLALHPHLFGHAMNDIKDTPMLLAVFAAIAAFSRALETDSRRYIVFAAAITGVGLATKVNSIWPAAFFAVTWLGWKLRGPTSLRAEVFRVAPALALATVALLGAYLLCSPQYHLDGFARFWKHVEFVLFQNTRVVGKDEFSFEPLQNLWRNSPLPLLPLSLIGYVIAWRSRVLSRPVLGFLSLLATIPVLRPCLPGMRYYNLVRHFLEVFPVLSIFAGIGLATLIRAVANLIAKGPEAARTRGVAMAIATCAVFAPQVYSMIRFHPWQTAWFNQAVGGLVGAQARGIVDADDYWCHSSRTAVTWLNEHADEGALIVDPFTPWMIGSLRKSDLRDDLVFIEADEGIELLVANGLLDDARDRGAWERAKVVIVTYVPQTRRYNQKPGARTKILEACERNKTPWHVIRAADGGEIVRFYRIETTK